MTRSGLDGRRGLVVLGMGRSGTSSVTRMFQKAGFYVGERPDLMAGDEANPTGYFENLKVWRANERMLRECKRAWFDPPTPTELLSVEPETRCGLERVLDELLAAAKCRPLALKDPRIGILMTVWWPLLRGVLHPVLVLRDPVEIAQSLERRDGTAVPVALAMWEVILTRTLDQLDGQYVTVVPYPAVARDTGLAGRLVGEAARYLLPELASAVEPSLAASALDPALHRNSASVLGDTRWLTSRQRELWQLLNSLAPGTALLHAPAFAKVASDEALLLAGYEKRRQDAYSELGARLERAASDIRARDQVLCEREQMIVEQRHQLDAAALQLEEHRADEAVARAERTELELRLRAAEHWLAEVQGARTWRMTEPLRRLAGAARKLRGSVTAIATRWRNHPAPNDRPSQAWRLAIGLGLVVAGGDALLGHHVVLLALLALSPCCALLTGRWTRTAAAGVFALALAVPLGLSDGIWGTGEDLAMLGVVLVASVLSTVAAAIVERRALR